MKISKIVSIAKADAAKSSAVSLANLGSSGSNSSKRAGNHNSSQ
jgi:hypothetical protein